MLDVKFERNINGMDQFYLSLELHHQIWVDPTGLQQCPHPLQSISHSQVDQAHLNTAQNKYRDEEPYGTDGT